MSAESTEARRIAEEATYWLAVLDVLREQNDSHSEIAAAAADGIVALLSLVTITDARANAFVLDGMEAIGLAMRCIQRAQDQTQAVVRLIEGRHTQMSGTLSNERG